MEEGLVTAAFPLSGSRVMNLCFSFHFYALCDLASHTLFTTI